MNHKVLFITPHPLGDTILTMGLISHMVETWPDCEITVATGPLGASLFEGIPNVTRIHTMRKKKHHRHWLELWLAIGGKKWDVVVDMKNSPISRTIMTKRRYIKTKKYNTKDHKVTQNAKVMNLSQAPLPRLWFSDAHLAKATDLMKTKNDKPIIAIGPTATWQGKVWPAENYITLIERLIASDEKGGLIPGANIAVFGAPGEEDMAMPVLKSVPKDQRIDMIDKGSPAEVGAALAQCDLFIGNDSGLMHMAAAAGIPTLGLFGPSYPHLYSPQGPKTAFISTPETYDELINYAGFHNDTCGSLMTSLNIDTVLGAVKKLIRSDC